MSAINDGGPAFPTLEVMATDNDGPITHAYLGMTMRDYFAAKVIQGLCGNSADEGPNGWGYEEQAQYAYKMADAMLKARDGE